MGKALTFLRGRVGVAVVGAVVLAGTGAGIAVAAPGTVPASDSTVVVSDQPAAPTTSEAAAAVEALVVQQPEVSPAPATVDTVTTSAPQEPAPAAGDGVGVTDAEGHYTPAPPIPGPGQPPVDPGTWGAGPAPVTEAPSPPVQLDQ